MTPPALVDKFVRLSSRRGEALAHQIEAVASLLDQSPVDISRVMSSAVLLDQGVAKAHVSLFGLLMADPDYGTWTLDLQMSVAYAAKLWADLWAISGNLAFAKRLLLYSAVAPTGAGAPFVANARGVELAVSLEDAINTGSAAGVTLDAFWSRSVSGIASLGRLLVVDAALSQTYEFDPLEEGFQLDAGLVPIAADAQAILARIDTLRPRDSGEPSAATAQAYPVVAGMDLFSFSTAVLGEPSAWRLIIDFNTLRFPYISDDPLDQLGSPGGTLILAESILAGSSRITLADATDLTIDHRLHIDDGRAQQVFTVLSVDADTGDVEVAPPATSDLQVGAVVTLYPADSDVIGRVLRTGDVLLVPSTVSPGGQTPLSLLGSPGEGVASEASLYGVDVEVRENGSLRLDNADLAFIAGRGNLTQALRHRIITSRGSLIYHPTYGADFEPIIGRRFGPLFTFLAQVEGKQAVLADPRIDRVSSISISADADTLSVDLVAVTKAQAQFPVTVQAQVRA